MGAVPGMPVPALLTADVVDDGVVTHAGLFRSVPHSALLTAEETVNAGARASLVARAKPVCVES